MKIFACDADDASIRAASLGFAAVVYDPETYSWIGLTPEEYEDEMRDPGVRS